ncbi:glycosyltransferase family 2 protein [soil metagenome]
MLVWVVDNASGDGTADMVAREFHEVELIVNSSNRGFSAANNTAIRAGAAPFVLALNPDTQITAGALDTMLEVMEEHPGAGIAGPELALPSGGLDHAARRSFPTPLSALGHFTGLGRRDKAGGRLAAYRAPGIEKGPVDAVNGAFMLMRRAALDEVGLFDEGYWMYMEDLDLSYRLREAGWLTWFEPSVTVTHVKAGTSGPVRSARLDRAFHYGMYRFYRKHYARMHHPLFNGFVYTGIGLKLAGSLLTIPVRRLAAVRRRRASGAGGAGAVCAAG